MEHVLAKLVIMCDTTPHDCFSIVESTWGQTRFFQGFFLENIVFLVLKHRFPHQKASCIHGCKFPS